MAQKRVTKDWDVERLSEAIYSQYGDNITDRASFDRAWNEFFKGVPTNSKQEITLRNKTFDKMRDKHNEISREKKEKQEQLPKKSGKQKYNYEHLARQKNKIVYARQSEVKSKGKTYLFLRSANGRFAKKQK